MSIDPPEDTFDLIGALRKLWAQEQRPMTKDEVDAWLQEMVDSRGGCLFPGPRRPKRWLH